MARFESRHSFLIRGAEAYLRLEVGLNRRAVSAHEEEGAVVGEDFPAHRAYVGAPEEWDLVASRQVTLLLAAGLRDTHRLVDVGCGSLRTGRMLIPYLRSERYFGVEPNRWLVEKGIEHELGQDLVKIKHPTFRFVDDFSLSAFGVSFDFALAHSVFSHAYPDLALTGFRGIAEALAPEGKLFATLRRPNQPRRFRMALPRDGAVHVGEDERNHRREWAGSPAPRLDAASSVLVRSGTPQRRGRDRRSLTPASASPPEPRSRRRVARLRGRVPAQRWRDARGSWDSTGGEPPQGARGRRLSPRSRSLLVSSRRPPLRAPRRGPRSRSPRPPACRGSEP
jgi:SAM-dependent methyltransferase